MTSRSEEEELAVIRDWWQRNGKPLLAGGLLALLIAAGWQSWQHHKTSQVQSASAMYQQLVTLAMSGQKPDPAKVSELTQTLNSDFSGTAYAQYASLLLARVAVDEGRLDDAASSLRKVVDAPVEPTLGELARQRLARVLATQHKTDDALALLKGEASAAFIASREELRGDVLAQAGKRADARAAYEKARAAQKDANGAEALQIKLDNVTDGEA